MRWALGRALPAVGRVLARDRAAYAYLPGSMDRFLSADAYAALLREAGFAALAVERLTLGVAHLVAGIKGE